MRVGIMGAGGIATAMAKTISEIKGVENYAIASRSKEKAEEFKKNYAVTKAYGSYEDMLADDKVDLVYIALPHSHHYEWTIKSLKAGKHVLCEKAFAVNISQAEEMINLSKEKNLLLAEAIWTRYMPSRKIIADLIRSGCIGEPMTISANLGYRIDHVKRLTTPELAGGALLDLGVYTLNFASMFFGNEIKKINASAVMHQTGVDGQDNIMIEYKDGRMANLFSTMYTLTDRRGLICGTDGFITIDNINNPSGIKVYEPDRDRNVISQNIIPPGQITGYEYEVLACKRAIESGKCECEEMPHSEMLEIMKQMDEIRSQIGVIYTLKFEKEKTG